MSNLVSMEVCPSSVHVVLFPFPASGHIKPFLNLAKLLCTAGLRVTFVSTDYNHARLHDRRDLETEFRSLHFESIPDGLPLDKPRDLLDPEFHASFPTAAKPFRELLVSSLDGGSYSGRAPVSCLITDVVVRFPIDVAEELGVPVWCFCTYSARYLFLYFWVPKLIQDGHLPYPEGKQEQKVMNGGGAPGEVQQVLRYKDLPGFWAMGGEIQHDQLNACLEQTLFTSRSSALILNTFDELEASFLTSLSKIYNKIYPIGPLHSLLNNNIPPKKEDPHSCLPWLDSRPSRSVVYVSFGSWVKLTSSRLMEFWNGLVNSGVSFLLVLRPDSIEGGDGEQTVREVTEAKAAEGRWLIVSWAPQEAVLAHEAVAAFLTHSGWNSILESVVAGVPMISWSILGDQSSNCVWVTKVWKTGLEMEDGCDRFTVEAMVRSMMKQPHEDEEMRNNVVELAKRANDGVCKGGTSYSNFQRLVQDIKKIKLQTL